MIDCRQKWSVRALASGLFGSVLLASLLLVSIFALPAVAETAEDSMYIGLSLEQNSKSDKALPFLKKCTEFKASTALSHAYKAMALNYLKQYQLAIAEADQALKINPEQYQAKEELSKAKQKLGKSGGGADGAPPPHGIISAQREAEDAKKGLKEFDEHIKKNPKDKDAYFERAEAFSNLHEYEKAAADYSKMISLDSADINSYLLRAKMYAKLRQPEKALADYDKVVSIAPQSLRLLLEDKARILLDLNEKQRVIDDCNRAINENWNEYWPYLLRAEVENDWKQYDAALVDCEKAFQIEPLACFDNCTLQKARAHLGLGQKEKAADECNIVIVIGSTSSDEASKELATAATRLNAEAHGETQSTAP